MSKGTDFAITLLLWGIWGILTAVAGLDYRSGGFWGVWAITLVMMVYAANKHHFIKN